MGDYVQSQEFSCSEFHVKYVLPNKRSSSKNAKVKSVIQTEQISAHFALQKIEICTLNISSKYEQRARQRSFASQTPRQINVS